MHQQIASSVATRVLPLPLAWGLCALALLAGCGQKGPLTLPSAPAPAATASAPAR